MQGKVNLKTKKEDYLKFLHKFDHQIYVQSPEYGIFNHKMGDDFKLVSYSKGSKILIASLVLIVKAKRGNFAYLPYGPLFSYEADYEDFKIFMQSLAELKKEYNINFIRLSPFYDIGSKLESWFKKYGLIKSQMHMIAEDCYFIDFSEFSNTDSIFKAMRQNHRNLTNKARKLGIEIHVSESIKDVKILSDLLNETAKRHGFVPFSYEYLKQEFLTFKKIKSVKIYKAIYEGEVVAASMHFCYGTHFVYKHGASSLNTKIPASYLLQFQAICDAFNAGYKYYNFWGIAKKGVKNHPFKGITTFKTGFKGTYKELIPAYDKILGLGYLKNFIVELFRKIKRGF